MTPDPTKPPYRVPSMPEIAAIPWNGLKVASTFSGTGGSCLGYRMAGFKVVWANEFVPAAQDSYRANMTDGCILDTRDIHEVQAEDILRATGLDVGDLDLFDGSPPCQAFSTAGKREKGWGKGKRYEHGAVQKNEQLFEEYIRLLRGLRPRTFVAENVSGLVKGTAKGYFLEILAALKASGYRVRCKVLDAKWLGVPQSRQRTIFVGVREDLGIEPVHPKPLNYFYSVRDALPWITMEKRGGSPNNWQSSDRPASTVVNSGAIRSESAYLSGATWCEARVIHDTGGQKETRYVKNKDVTDQPCPAITNGIAGLNSCHFKVETRRVEPDADITGYAIGAEWDKLKPGEQSEKYFSLVKPGLDASCPTVSASGGGNSIASVVHPTERRKFTIAELKRICAFPDDFILTGSYAQQWERLGNSVPPVMMRHIAEVIRDGILLKRV